MPLVATIHATEAGRHQGWLPGEMNRSIHSVEWWLATQAERVLVCSAYMRWEVAGCSSCRPASVEVIPNGVDGSVWQAGPRAVAAARARFAGDGPLIGYAGRLVYEKGVQDLVDARCRELRAGTPALRLVIAGDGPHRAELRGQAQRAAAGAHGQLHRLPGRDGELPARARRHRRRRGAQPLRAVRHGRPGGGRGRRAAGRAAHRRARRDRRARGDRGDLPAKDPAALADAVDSLLADEVFARRVAKRPGPW